MRKICIMALFSMIITCMSAKDKVLLDEDFSWVPWTGSLTTCAYNATGELRIDHWDATARSYGWTSKDNCIYTRPYYIKLGKTNYGGDLCSPALKGLDKDEKVTAVLTFQAVRYCNDAGVKDPGVLHVAILNAGKVTAISGGMTTGNVDKIDNAYSVSAYPGITSAATIQLDPENLTGTSADSPEACWKNPVSKYTITIEGATAETQVLFVGGTYNSGPTDRPCIDNVKVITTIKVDPNDIATVIAKKDGKTLAYRNNEIDSVYFDYSAYVDKEHFEPEVVIKQEYIDPTFPQNVKTYAYEGPKVSLEDAMYTFTATSNNCVSGQSGAAYGDYLFVVKDKLAAIYMYDLKNKVMVASRALTAHNETVSASSSSVLYHCNQSTFGTLKYDPADEFPLLYVSQRAPASTKRCFVNVLRIVPTKNAAGQYVSFQIQEVQTIHLPVATKANALGNANFTIDPQTGDFYSYSRNNTSSDSNYMNCRITKFKTVDLSEPVAYLEDSDILESYEIFSLDGKANVSALNMQGGFIWNKKLYISQGYPSCGFINLRVVDLEQQRQINDIDLLKDGFPSEPEGMFMHDGHIKIAINGSAIYTFYFQ